MAVYLGDGGLIELKRTSIDTPLSSQLDPGDVNEARRRFSFDFPAESLLTGDQLEIKTEDGSTLELVAGHAFPDGRWYCHIDDAGGIRLYGTFTDAIAGSYERALPLVTPTVTKAIQVTSSGSRHRCLGAVRDWSLTTNRETVDLTSLGEWHRSSYSNGLISGQGRLSCLWNYERRPCDPTIDEQQEISNYLAQLILRVDLGALFEARLFASYARTAGKSSVWWEASCIVTNVGMNFAPGQPVAADIEFITTGPIHLRVGDPPAHLLQENSSLLLLEGGEGSLLLEDA
jgi:hypothetical protein